MRFTMFQPSSRAGPSFSQRRNRRVFLSIAAAEVALLTMLLLLFLRLRSSIDQSLLLSLILLVMGVLTYGFVRSVTLAQSALFLCTLGAEVLLYTGLPPMMLSFSSISVLSTDLMPPLFFALDVLLVVWIMGHGMGSLLEAEGKESSNSKK